ncbi:MAG: dihydrolipoyl dehydrogenase [Candidatus Gastranaerophilales bacterium]|nr:dihydrolipoyl dehydrogenase [Candidatus Gastranaerophilales bacterium]
MQYDIAIIGAGPGGYVAAIRAAQLGVKVALIERENVGGVCLNWGCIPTKAVITSMDKYNEAQKFSKYGINLENLSYDYEKISERKWSVVDKIRKNLTGLIKSYKIDIISGEAAIESVNLLKITQVGSVIDIEYKYLIIATGSRPVSLPGLTIDHKFILDTNDILSLESLPESILLVGSGASGIEWSRIFNSFGKKVILTEMAPRLAPMFDVSISERIERIFKRQRIEFFTGTRISKIEATKVTLDNGKEFSPDIIFLAAGRAPNIEINGLEKLGIKTSKKGIEVDDNLRTNIDNIYAIGDITGILPLAHVASHQGMKAVENILLNKTSPINYLAVPKIIYGNPEIASVGYSEEELIAQNISYESSEFPMSAIGKSLIEDQIEGFVKVLADKNRILGVHIIANQAAAMIQQAAIAINCNLSPDDLKDTIFAHPTYSEALYESFLGIDGSPIHLPIMSS